MTPEQREVAITAMAAAIHRRLHEPQPLSYDTEASVALAALLSEFVVIPKDDVTEEQERHGGQRLRRLVTYWEPIP